jgi:alpha-beta hydrolase superfamily lysophospholipase
VTASLLNSGVYRASEFAIETNPRITRSQYGVILAHPAGGNASTGQITPYNAFVEALASAGYPVHGGDLCAATYKSAVGTLVGAWGTQCFNFGNADHISAIGSAFTRLVAMGAKSGKFYGFGASMGTMGLLNYAKANPANIGGLVLYIPPLDLVSVYLNLFSFAGNATTYVVPFATAYGLAAPVTHASCTWTTAAATITDASATSAINGYYVLAPGIPVGTTVLSVSGSTVNLSATPTGAGTSASVTYAAPPSGAQLSASSPAVWGASTLAGIPIQIFASDNDPVASNTAACQAWAAGQSNITVTSMGAVGHSLPTSRNPQEVVGFFDANGGRL